MQNPLFTSCSPEAAPKLKSHKSAAYQLPGLTSTLCLFLALTFVAGPSALRAAEPILKLAMAKSTVPSPRFSNAKEPAGGNSTNPFAIAARRTKFTPPAGNTPGLSASLLLAKPAAPAANPFLLTHKKAALGARTGWWGNATLQAGYGQIFWSNAEKTYRPTGTDWEEPGCGYLKLGFSF